LVCSHGDAATIGETAGIDHQVEQHLTDAHAVAKNAGQVARHVDREREMLGLKKRPHGHD